MFLLKKIIAALLLPPVGPLLLAALGLALAGRRRWLGRALMALGAGLLIALSLPVVAHRLLHSLESAAPIDPAGLARGQAIVVLAGGGHYHAPEYGGPTVNGITLERLRYAARLARASGLPLLVTGGAPFGGRPEAESMAEALASDFGLPPRWVETASRDTAENAAFSAPILKAAGVTRIVLVSNAWHLPRGREHFERLGFQVLPAPMGFSGQAPEEIARWLPGAGALAASRIAINEWLGRAVGAARAAAGLAPAAGL